MTADTAFALDSLGKRAAAVTVDERSLLAPAAACSALLLIATLVRRRRSSGHHGNLASGVVYVYCTELNEWLRLPKERDHP